MAKWAFICRPAEAGSRVDVGVGIELGEELLDGQHAEAIMKVWSR